MDERDGRRPAAAKSACTGEAAHAILVLVPVPQGLRNALSRESASI